MKLNGWIALITELEKLDRIAYLELRGRLKALVSMAQDRSWASAESSDYLKGHPSKEKAGELINLGQYRNTKMQRKPRGE